MNVNKDWERERERERESKYDALALDIMLQTYKNKGIKKRQTYGVNKLNWNMTSILVDSLSNYSIIFLYKNHSSISDWKTTQTYLIKIHLNIFDYHDYHIYMYMLSQFMCSKDFINDICSILFSFNIFVVFHMPWILIVFLRASKRLMIVIEPIINTPPHKQLELSLKNNIMLTKPILYSEYMIVNYF